MKRGFRALAVLAAIAVASAGPQVFAVCAEFGGFAIFQCADRAWFDAPPDGSGSVNVVFWQIGYGNGTLNSGMPPASQGTGMQGVGPAATFNGNDNGLFAVDLVDALGAIQDSRVPAGALCMRSNNWGNSGIDGCCDNVRDPVQPVADDDILNPLYDVYYARNGYPGYASTDWVQDYPMGVLLTESGGHYFAVAAVATSERAGPSDIRVGDYNFRNVTGAGENPITAETNIVPWQRIPGDRDPATSTYFVIAVAENSDTTRTVDLEWNAAVVYNDASLRPSTNPTVAGGVGIADLVPGGLVRYVVETQPIQDANDPIGTLDPGLWVPVFSTTGTAAQIIVDPDTCVRLHTYFGREPQTSTHELATCRLAQCGDLGYDVASTPSCIGGPLVADGAPQNVSAERVRGSIIVKWDTNVELSVSRFDIFGIKDGERSLVGQKPCAECTTGAGASYVIEVRPGTLKGARIIEIVAVGPDNSAQVKIK